MLRTLRNYLTYLSQFLCFKLIAEYWNGHPGSSQQFKLHYSFTIYENLTPQPVTVSQKPSAALKLRFNNLIFANKLQREYGCALGVPVGQDQSLAHAGTSKVSGGLERELSLCLTSSRNRSQILRTDANAW